MSLVLVFLVLAVVVVELQVGRNLILGLARALLDRPLAVLAVLYLELKTLQFLLDLACTR